MLRNGDVLRVSRLRPTLDAGVVLQGHVFTPGNYAYRQGMHLTDVIHSVDELRVLVGCAWHTLRRRCGYGIVMGAHAAGRLAQLAAERRDS